MNKKIKNSTAISRFRQCGVSLVGIMVGMLLAMITILASLVLYRSMVHTSVDSRIDATLDGQIATAMLTLQLELQGAGFGYEQSAAVHALVDSSSIYWRYYDTNTNSNVCRGFKVETNDNVTLLKLLHSTSCDSTSSLGSFTWETLSELSQLRVPAGQTPPAIDMSMATAACFPYGMSDFANYPQVQIRVVNSLRNNEFVYRYCLANIANI